MKMMVSGISEKEGKRVAYVLFEEETGETAEAVIPECKVVSNKGFTEDEVEQLETYMRDHLTELKKQAAGINPLTALMKD